MNPLRILYANASLDEGEPERYTHNLMQAMRAQGHHVEALCQPKAPLKQRLEQDGFHVHPLHMGSGWGVLRTVLPLKRLLLSQHFDVVHTQTHHDSLSVGLAARLARHPLIVRTQHFGQSDSAFTDRWLAHGVIALSHFVKKSRVQKGVTASRIEVVYPAVDTPPPNTTSLRQRLGVADEATMVGSMVAAGKEKGALELIQALAPLMRESPQLHLVIANNTDSDDTLVSFAEQLDVHKQVHRLAPTESIVSFMGELDVFALAAPTEASAIVFAKAAAQVAVVAAQVGSIPEMIEVGKSGMLVPVHDIVALRKALQRLVQDPALRQSMAAAGYDYIVGSGRFTQATQQQLTESHYRQWLSQHKLS